MSAPTTMTEEKKSPLHLDRAPISKPPFTLSDLKKAIPPHCFKKSLLRSSSYVVCDLILVAFFYYIATTYFPLLPYPLSYIAWPIYWICQGSVCTGLWVVGHDCGHHAFSNYPLVDDTVGFVVHSALMVPYFSWSYSHRRHHANTNSLENDEVYIPKPKSKLAWFYKVMNDNPLGRLLILTITIIFGFPMYLAFNVSGRQYDGHANHFHPNSPIYNDRERLQVFISDVGVIATSYVLYRAALAKGLSWVMCIYGVPLLIVNGLFVSITYLHHTHRSIPHYDSSEWDFLKGALSTIDRDYGILNKVLHNVTHTHVTHHIFSTIPHYHAMEATAAIKPLLGEFYRIDHTPFLKALWREAKECMYIEPDEERKGVYWYKNKL